VKLSVKGRIAVAMTVVVAVNVLAGAVSWGLYAAAARKGAEAQAAAEQARRAVVASQYVTEFMSGATDLALSVSRANASQERSLLYGDVIGAEQTTNRSVNRVATTAGGAQLAGVVSDWEALRLGVYTWINAEAQASGADLRMSRDSSGRFRASTDSNLEPPAAYAGLTAAQIREKVRGTAEHFKYATLGDIVSSSEANASAAATAEEEARQLAQWGTVALVSVSALVALLLGIGLYRSIARPLSAARDYANAVAAGDYGATLAKHTDDEIGVLTHAVENMKDGLVHEMGVMREMAGVVLFTTEGVRDAVERTASAVDQPDHDVQTLKEGLSDVEARVIVLADLSQQMLGA
jgi:HAMP domain-containing protein